MSHTTNRLIHETSPYLRQHAHNPVDWYPWGEEAFAKARAENKPILLSIGYSACHWCHVMERESFEDPATARLMNEHFVNIKVDREERPDIDQIYMSAVQVLTGHGGWPMTMFLRPDGQPFYGGTYFPPEDRHGLPSFQRLLQAIASAYRDKSEEIDKTADRLMQALQQMDSARPDGDQLDPTLVSEAAQALSRSYDETNGGIGQAPKFPNESVLDLFLRVYEASGQQRYLDMVLHTLRQMARGGLYDQIGGGFHRYSVDERWLVPHFEKMLYDNAQLVPLYLSAYQITRDPFFARIANETLGYVLREMHSPEGGFYSSQDADSEGIEGKYFVWKPDEVRTLLGEEKAEIVCRYWDISEHGNFEHANILHVTLEFEQLAKLFRREVAEIETIIAEAQGKMLAARETRVKPGRDEKVLTAWNGLMISAFARAAAVLDSSPYAAVARTAVAFVEEKLARGDRLLSVYKDGVAKLNGHLDDYAFFITALLDVYELLQEERYLDRAVELAESMIRHFQDPQSGGFYFTSDDHEQLIVRSKPAFDGSIPSGNSVACRALLRLYHLVEDTRYLKQAEQILHLYANPMRDQPFGFAHLLGALDFLTRQPKEVVILAPGGIDAATALLRPLRQTFVANQTMLVGDSSRGAPPKNSLFEGKTLVDGKPTAYVCHRQTCSAPVTTWEGLEPLLH